MTISIDTDLAEYLRSTPSVSSTVAEAVDVYRARELDLTLEEAYEEDAEEAEHLNQEWSRVDSELGD